MSVYAVNFKEPVAAWIPSRDNTGNGTTTLYDLMGTAGNNGTLTNMDAATDWVSDTGAGGIRALDFDNANDVVTSAFAVAAGPYAISFWDRVTSDTVVQGRVQIGVSGNYPFEILRIEVNGYGRISFGQWDSTNSVGSVLVPSIGFSVGVWQHWLITGSDITSNTPASHRIFCNGVEYTTFASGLFSAFSGGTRIGQNTPGQNANCRLDDIRVFSVACDQADATYLYFAGGGRGRVMPNESRRRRQSVSGGVL